MIYLKIIQYLYCTFPDQTMIEIVQALGIPDKNDFEYR